MKYVSALVALAMLAACVSPAEAGPFNRNVSKSVTVVRNGRNVDVQKIVVEQQDFHAVQQLKVVAVPVQAYSAPVQQFSADCHVQQFSQAYSQPVVVERVIVQEQNHHCQKFFRR